MSDKHTPGPWWYGCDDKNEQPHVMGKDGNLVAVICHECVMPRDELMANTSMVMSAPCLLDGVRMAVKALNHIPRHSLPKGDSYELASLLEALIAKATSPP